MFQLPIMVSAQATQPATQATDAVEISLTAESIEQLVGITFEETMQEVVETLESGDHPEFAWTATIPMDPMQSLRRLQTGSSMPEQVVPAGKPLPFQFSETSLTQPELCNSIVLPEIKNGLLMETHIEKTDLTTASSVLCTTHDAMLKAFDPRSGSELTGQGSLISQAPLVGPQSLSSSLSGKFDMVTLPVETPVGQPGWDKAVGERIHWMIGRNIQNAEMKLTPPNLGPVEIRISVHNDQASVSFIAAQAPTREALEAAIPRLREMLGEANLNLADVDVGKGDGSESHQGQEPDAGGHAYSSMQAISNSDDTSSIQSRLVSEGLLDDYA